MTERLIFGTSVEGMLRALGPTIAPDVKAKLLGIGVNPDKLLPAYGVPAYSALLDLIGLTRFPNLELQARDRELGREFIRGFGQTFVGKATLAMGRVLGPMRATMRLTRTMRSVNNYSTSEATKRSDTSVHLWCQPVLRPWYYVGVFEEAGGQIHGPSYVVELQKFENERADFLIRW